MTTPIVSIALDALVACLLAAVIVYAWRLNRMLVGLRDGKAELAATIAKFDEAAAHAERAVAQMGQAADQAGEGLRAAMGEATALRDELVFLTERGDGIAARLAGVSAPKPAPGKPRPRPTVVSDTGKPAPQPGAEPAASAGGGDVVGGRARASAGDAEGARRRLTGPSMKLLPRPRLPRPRLLPAVMFAAAALLTVRVGDLWHDVSLAVGAPGEAQSTGAAAPSAPANSADKMADKMAAPPAGQSTIEPQRFGSEGPALTEQEIAVLEKLAKRREALDAREREIDLRANLLAATEKRIGAKLADLKAIQGKIAALLKEHDSEQRAKLGNLVKIYENMKPKDAAAIFEKLDLPIVLDVIEGMRVQKSGAILAQMNPSRAEKVTAAIADRRKLPQMP